MDKPKSPCKKDCDFRSAKCHNESCPYGWAEYEKKKAEFIEHIQNEQIKYFATTPLTDARKRLAHKNTLKKKQMGKF